jgi:hypothetical protein
MLSQYILLHRRNVASGWATASRRYNWIVLSAHKSGLSLQQQWSHKLTSTLTSFVFWSVTTCSRVATTRRFRVTCNLNHCLTLERIQFIVSWIFKVNSRWRWVVSFTDQPLCPMGKSRCTPWLKGCVSPKIFLHSMEKKYLSLAWSNPYILTVQPIVQSSYWLS